MRNLSAKNGPQQKMKDNVYVQLCLIFSHRLSLGGHLLRCFHFPSTCNPPNVLTLLQSTIWNLNSVPFYAFKSIVCLFSRHLYFRFSANLFKMFLSVKGIFWHLWYVRNIFYMGVLARTLQMYLWGNCLFITTDPSLESCDLPDDIILFFFYKVIRFTCGLSIWQCCEELNNSHALLLNNHDEWLFDIAVSGHYGNKRSEIPIRNAASVRTCSHFQAVPSAQETLTERTTYLLLGTLPSPCPQDFFICKCHLSWSFFSQTRKMKWISCWGKGNLGLDLAEWGFLHVSGRIMAWALGKAGRPIQPIVSHTPAQEGTQAGWEGNKGEVVVWLAAADLSVGPPNKDANW